MQVSWGNLAPHASHSFETSREDQAHALLNAMAGLQKKKTHPTSTVQILAHVISTDVLFAKSSYVAKPRTSEVGSTPCPQWDFVL